MKVGVIMGGISSERDVSLATGKEMMAHLDRAKYEVIPIDVRQKQNLLEQAKGIDIALLALHGSFGEDGTIQGTLETMGIPYTGCSLLSSSICMDKDLSKRLLRYEGLHTPDWTVLRGMDDLRDGRLTTFGYPMVIKPNAGGSSIGVTLVRNEEKLLEALQTAFVYGEEVMVEEYIDGEEITCSMLNGEFLPILSIKPGAEFFDYTSKYEPGRSDEQVAVLDDETVKRVREATEHSFCALKCSVYARVDMMLKDGEPYILEVNTLPGMTETSLLPRSALAAGFTFSKLLDAVIEGSLAARQSSQPAAPERPQPQAG
ncbi:D-alanine--D-alanine ligase [Paenibacillus sp.]|jgi:D-alanine-D-alanine ligase|uniref:D-alanine--D-alanine ligase n=1 Tax=Paenibacillus sp. TaxID=58172 RepID=UPI00282538B2|nr:D-alanine--D-alanine ligase [Paenibacillus sp.]MDR0270890.1 D-alanine--D-alanine ligase [Paenibacillus sp.]